MKLLFFVLNKTEKLDALLTEFAHREIHGATVMESVGMARVLSHRHDADEIPFLGSIRAFLNPEKEKGNVIFTVIKDEQLPAAIAAIEYIVGDLSAKDNGVVFCMPIDYAKGFCGIGD